MRAGRLIWLLAVVCLPMSCSRDMPASEAVRSLQVLDSQLNHLVYALDKPEYRALSIANNLDILPFNYAFGQLKLENNSTKEFAFAEHTGNYRISPDLASYERTYNTDKISLHFALDTVWPILARVDIDIYEDVKLDALHTHPLLTRQKVYINDTLKLCIDYRSSVEDGIPKELELKIEEDNAVFKLDIHRTRGSDTGTLKLNFTGKHKGYSFLSSSIDADIVYSRSGYYFEDVTFDCRVFDHTLNGLIRYGEINPETRQYTESFNANASINIAERNDILGNVILITDKNNYESDLSIKFNDGTTRLLRDYLIVLDKLYHYKL